MSEMNPKVDFYFNKSEKWLEALETLRIFVLDCQLTETLKWGVPCYTFQQSNVVLLHEFKNYCAILFVKGALLKDPANILIQQTEHTQAARQIRFTSVEQILNSEATIKAYIQEAIEIAKTGLQVEYKKPAELIIPEELQQQFNKNTALKAAFTMLTPGRQRAYLIHFSAPKQPKTRESRVAKAIPSILNGKGLNG